MKVNKNLDVSGRIGIYLYLENWQMRMIKDYLGIDCDAIEIPMQPPIIALYGIPVPHPESKRMYLTDWQIREINKEIGSTCQFIDISANLYPYVKYAAPTPKYKVPTPSTPTPSTPEYGEPEPL